MSSDSIPDFLADQRDEVSEELQPLVLKFEEYWERKLWHELTDTLIEFFNNPQSADFRISFYKVFVLKFANKINQLKLVDLALKAASQYRGRTKFPRLVHSNLLGRLTRAVDKRDMGRLT